MRNRSGIAPSEILNQSSNVQRQLAVHNDETVVDVFRIAETEINSPPVLLIEQMVSLQRRFGVGNSSPEYQRLTTTG
jgi:hypothetical protein